MKYRIIGFVTLLAVVAVGAWADTDAHARSIADVENEIRSTLGLGAEATIDPAKVPDELLVELGDAVMAAHVGDEQTHEWMDTMMGGEGSDSLDAAHRWMAYNYLAGGYTGRFGMMGGMMGSGSMMGTNGRGYGIMGNPDVYRRGYPADSPKTILDRRYASGEITKEQYQQMLDDIQ